MGNTSSQAKHEEIAQEEIIIMAHVKDIMEHFVKENVILWYDPNIYSKDISTFLEELKTISDIKTFSDWQEAAQYLKDTKISCCQVITSGTNGELLVKEISQLQNIYSIHIFCVNKDYHEKWAREYPKVIAIEKEFNQLKANLEKELMFWQREQSSLRINLPSYAPIFENVHKIENTNLHSYLKVFLSFENRNQAKKDLLDLAGALYGSKNKYIEDFKNTYDKYNMKDILNWYTKNCFLYMITNDSLRIATPDSIQYCRLVLHDLEQAIKQKYQQESKNFSGLLYRAACISDQEWTNLVLNIGKEIEMHGFLSTSKNKLAALKFLNNEINKKAMITIIVPAAPEKGDQGFAEIQEYSDYKDEEEVLFNVMSKFTILDATEECNEERKYRHLVLLYGAQAIRKFTLDSPSIKINTKSLKRCYVCGVKLSILNIPLVLVNPIKRDECCCLNCFDKYKAENKCAFIGVPSWMISRSEILEIKGFVMKNKSTLNIPFYRSQCQRCETKNFKYYSKCINCEEKKEYCEQCFYQNVCIRGGHIIILETHPFSFWSEKMSEKELNYLIHYQKELECQESSKFQKALIFQNTHNYNGVIEYINKFLERSGRRNDIDIAVSYDFLGSAYLGMEEYQKVIQLRSQALEIRKAVLGDQHRDTANSYNNLGNAYFWVRDYQEAIYYYSKGLEIQEKILRDRNPDVAFYYHNMGSAYYEMGEYQKAIEFSSKALEIRKEVLGDQHPATAASCDNLGLAYHKMKDQKAIEFHSQALEIRKTVLGYQHPDTATSYHSLGLAYYEKGEYKKAIEFSSKALEIRKEVLGDQHPDTAASYNNLGLAYCEKGEYQKAIEFLSRALEIRKTVLGEQHLDTDTAASYHKLGLAYYEMGEYQKAIEFSSKALEIRKKVLGDQHPDTAASYNNLGLAYCEMGEYLKAIILHSKAREIRKAVLSDQHLDTAASYNNLGLTYYEMGEYHKAILFYSKVLKIKKTVLGHQYVETLMITQYLEKIRLKLLDKVGSSSYYL